MVQGNIGTKSELGLDEHDPIGNKTMPTTELVNKSSLRRLQLLLLVHMVRIKFHMGLILLRKLRFTMTKLMIWSVLQVA